MNIKLIMIKINTLEQYEEMCNKKYLLIKIGIIYLRCKINLFEGGKNDILISFGL